MKMKIKTWDDNRSCICHKLEEKKQNKEYKYGFALYKNGVILRLQGSRCDEYNGMDSKRKLYVYKVL